MEIGAARLDECRWIQQKSAASAANDLNLMTDAVPAGKIWSIIALDYYPSVAETRYFFWGRVTRVGTFIAAVYPQNLVLSLESLVGCVHPTDPVVLFPGERLQVKREVATAGSTMNIRYAYIETDAPFPGYIDPLRSITRKPRRSLLPGGGGGGESGPGTGEGSAGTGFGGGGGPAEPLL